MSVKFEDPEIEHYVLAALLKGADYWKDVPPDWFKDDTSRKTYIELRKFLGEPYYTYPTADLVVEKSTDVDVQLLVQELTVLPIEKREVNVRIQDMFDMYASRQALIISESIPDDLGKRPIKELVRDKIVQLSDLLNPFEVGQIKRRFIFDGAIERWETYKEIEANPLRRPGMRYHISELDRLTNGGLRKTHIALLFAESGGYKTKTLANIAYNLAFLERKDVMVVTLEVPLHDYEHIIDSRHSYLDWNVITTGRLDPGAKTQYRNALIQIHTQRPRLYIVDIPGGSTSADLIRELEKYYTKFGKYPDVVVLDYINEMSPVNVGQGSTSEKFKNLGVEIRQITRSYGPAFIGAMQENREGKKIKDKEKIGVEHIGESHYFQNVCHLVVHLWQDADGLDDANNTLNWAIKKNRYGAKHRSFVTFANPSINYIGDRMISKPEGV